MFANYREQGAVLIDNIEIANLNTILDANSSGESTALLAEFKIAINAYLQGLLHSPVRSLADLIAFNNKYSDLVCLQPMNYMIFFGL